jgi:hypothetical protein
LVDEIGIVPVRLLLFNNNVSNWPAFPNCGGIGPVKSLPLKSNNVNSDNNPNATGMLPLKALSCKSLQFHYNMTSECLN